MTNTKKTNVLNFGEYKSIKEAIEEANERIASLEHALYSILDIDRLDVAKEIAAEAVCEDLEIWLEADNLAASELDFDDDDNVPWDDVQDIEKE